MSTNTPIVLGPEAIVEDVISFAETGYSVVECYSRNGIDCVLRFTETDVNAVLLIRQNQTVWHILCRIDKEKMLHALKQRADNPATAGIFITLGSYYDYYDSTTDPKKAYDFVEHNWTEGVNIARKSRFKDLSIQELLRYLHTHTHILAIDDKTGDIEFAVVKSQDETGEICKIVSPYYDDGEITLFECYTMSTCAFTSVIQWANNPGEYAIEGITTISGVFYELKGIPEFVERMNYQDMVGIDAAMQYLGWNWTNDN